MTTYADFQRDLIRLCEHLRRAGVAEGKVDMLAMQWLRTAPVTEIEEVAGALEMIEEHTRTGAGPTEKFDNAAQLLERLKHAMERQGVPAAPPEPTQTEGVAKYPSIKYPNIRVELADLGEKIGPIIRRVSYVLSDAGVDAAEIEQYKSEVRNSADPLGVTRRWVVVGK